MTKSEAFDKGYCKHCAGWNKKRDMHMCGITCQESELCMLPEEAVERWKSEHGLEGIRKRSPKGAFGAEEHMKKKRGARAEVKYKQ